MPYAIAICAFFGAWLLAAGSVYQAAIELDRVQVGRARLAQAKDAQPPPPQARFQRLPGQSHSLPSAVTRR